MALIRWEPVGELNTIQSEMNRLFNNFFEGTTTSSSGSTGVRRWVPAMDLVETEDEQREGGCYRVERGWGSFARSLTLPGRRRQQRTIEEGASNQ